MRYYFAIFIPAIEGGYAVVVPDFPEVFTQGNDAAEGMEMITEVLAITVEEYAKARRDLPTPSTLEQIKQIAVEEMQGEGVDASRDSLLQLIAAPEVDFTPVRINISLPKHVLDSIDAKAQQQGLTRSGFLARAAQAFM